jgi:putative intracellular protease/amidase
LTTVPKSDKPGNQAELMERFKKDLATQKVLANTVKLADAKADDNDTVFYAGGHGPMWDLTNDKNRPPCRHSSLRDGNGCFRSPTATRPSLARGRKV